MAVVYIKDMGDEIPGTKCKEISCEVCKHNIRKLGWAKHLNTRKHIENEKGVEEVEKNNAGNVDAGECLNYIGEKMLLAIFAWDIGKAGERRMRRKLGK